MTRNRSLPRVARLAIAAAACTLAALGFAVPTAAQGVIGTGSGRTGAIVAWVLALIGVVSGGLALAGRRIGTGNRRDGAIVAVVMGLVGTALAVLHLATSRGGIGSGNGRAGAIVAVVFGLIGVVLGRLAVARSSRTG